MTPSYRSSRTSRPRLRSELRTHGDVQPDVAGPAGRRSQHAFTSCQWQKAVAKRGSAKRTQPAIRSGVGGTLQKRPTMFRERSSESRTECMATRDLRTPSILLVSNSVDERYVYTHAMRSSGYRIVLAETTILAYPRGRLSRQ